MIRHFNDLTYSSLLDAKISIIDHGLRLSAVHGNAIPLVLNALHIAPLTTLPAAIDQIFVPGILVAQRVI